MSEGQLFPPGEDHLQNAYKLLPNRQHKPQLVVQLTGSIQDAETREILLDLHTKHGGNLNEQLRTLL